MNLREDGVLVLILLSGPLWGGAEGRDVDGAGPEGQMRGQMSKDGG